MWEMMTSITIVRFRENRQDYKKVLVKFREKFPMKTH